MTDDDSQDGQGSTSPAGLPPAAARRGKILVVDDEDLVLRAIKRILREHDLTCLGSAAQALALIDRGERFDLVLSDLIMPNMNGIAFHAALSRRDPELARRVVFLSGGALNADEEEFLQASGNTRLAKPFQVDALVDTVRRLLAER
jgi:CheY-like chemotaxis protein